MSKNAIHFHRLVMQPTLEKPFVLFVEGNIMDLRPHYIRLLTLEEALQDHGEGVVDLNLFFTEQAIKEMKVLISE
jgi:hypothetical protein